MDQVRVSTLKVKTNISIPPPTLSLAQFFQYNQTFLSISSTSASMPPSSSPSDDNLHSLPIHQAFVRLVYGKHQARIKLVEVSTREG